MLLPAILVGLWPAITRRQSSVAVAAEKEHVRMKSLSLVGLETVHEQPFALADAVLLAAQ